MTGVSKQDLTIRSYKKVVTIEKLKKGRGDVGRRKAAVSDSDEL